LIALGTKHGKAVPEGVPFDVPLTQPDLGEVAAVACFRRPSCLRTIWVESGGARVAAPASQPCPGGPGLRTGEPRLLRCLDLDRGDEFFEQFTERHSALLAEQEAGNGAFYVLVDGDGSVLGRFNLVFAGDGTAELGYRVAQHAAGRGVATAAVRDLCQVAATRHGLRTLRAATSRENAASQKVLAKAGFVPAGPAGPADLGGKSGTWYQRDLAAG
jgi:L-amino acid N-acyltransferase YncA